MKSQLAEPGTVIGGKYEVERLLGQGGMGAVYVVRHTVTHKRLALKQLLPEASGGTHNDRFVREARAAGRVQHRHVVDIFDVGADATGLYMVMELLEGKPLADMLQDETLTLQELLLVLSRAMQGVAAAHGCGVIHRDLKPDNIFVCAGPSGRLDDPRVLDFGISKSQADPNLTESGVMLGTPYYMSPEQVYARRDIDARVDVYAMGVILYEAIAGQRPFEADSVSALAVMIATAQPLPLHELRPDIPEALCDVVHKALSRERDDRYDSMDALVQAIEPFIPKVAEYHVPADQALPLRTPRSGGEPTPLAMAPTEASMPPSASPARGRPKWKWAVWAVALGLVAAVAVWLTRPAPQPQPVASPATAEEIPEAVGAGSGEPEGRVPPQAPPVDVPPAAVEPSVVAEPRPVEPPPSSGDPHAGGEAAPTPEVADGPRSRESESSRRTAQAARRARAAARQERASEAAESKASPNPPPVDEASPADTTTATEVRGRAGTLGVDDF